MFIYWIDATNTTPPPPKTSNSLTWTLHLLSKYPRCQEKLFKEVSTLVPADRTPFAKEVTQMPYLRAVVKESLRWSSRDVQAQTASKLTIICNHTIQFPFCSVFVFKYDAGCFRWFLWTEESWQINMSRLVDIASQRMWVWFICGDDGSFFHFFFLFSQTAFNFSHYAIGRDEDTFPEPATFLPERWLQDSRNRPNAFGAIPFGVGVRGCVGRRIAELEMYLFLFHVSERRTNWHSTWTTFDLGNCSLMTLTRV